MPGNSGNPLSFGQIDADLFMAEAAIREAENLTSKAGSIFAVWQDTIYSRLARN